MMELSISAIDPDGVAAKVSKNCTHTPAPAYRLKRL
jgi:hypothetical protein